MFSIGNNILFFVPYLLDHRMNNLSAYAFYFMNWLHRSLYFFGLSLCPFFNLPPFFVYSDSIGLIKLPLKVPLNFMVLKIETYFLSVLEATAPGQGASWFGSWWGTVISQLMFYPTCLHDWWKSLLVFTQNFPERKHKNDDVDQKLKKYFILP